MQFQGFSAVIFLKFFFFFKFWGLEYISNPYFIMWGCNAVTPPLAICPWWQPRLDICLVWCVGWVRSNYMDECQSVSRGIVMLHCVVGLVSPFTEQSVDSAAITMIRILPLDVIHLLYFIYSTFLSDFYRYRYRIELKSLTFEWQRQGKKVMKLIAVACNVCQKKTQATLHSTLSLNFIRVC